MVDLAVGFELEIREVFPVIDDQEIFLDLTGGLVGMQPRAAPDHLPKLNLAKHGLREDQVLDGGDVYAGVEHVHRNSHTRHGAVLEIIQRRVSALHMAIDNLSHALALQLRIQTVKSLVEPLCMGVADGEDDGLVW
ncbi:hypothetical protein D3C75_1101500 [compost metagenome]